MEHLEKLREQKRKLKKQILVIENIYRCEIKILHHKRELKIHPDFTTIIENANKRIEILERVKEKLTKYLKNLQKNGKEI